jgi:hypothetical protein
MQDLCPEEVRRLTLSHQPNDYNLADLLLDRLGVDVDA